MNHIEVLNKGSEVVDKIDKIYADYGLLISDEEENEYEKIMQTLNINMAICNQTIEVIRDILQETVNKIIDALYYDEYKPSKEQSLKPYDKFVVSMGNVNNDVVWTVKYKEFSDLDYNFERDISRAIISYKERKINEWGRKKIKSLDRKMYKLIKELDKWCDTVESKYGNYIDQE